MLPSNHYCNTSTDAERTFGNCFTEEDQVQFCYDEYVQQVLKDRSESWMYDWMLDLEEWDTSGESRAKGIFGGRRGPDAVAMIRDRLHQLQKKMPCWYVLNSIMERASSLITTSASKDGVPLNVRNEEILGNMTGILYGSNNERNHSEVAREAYHGLATQRLAAELQAHADEDHRKDCMKNVTNFVKNHVLLLLETLYCDLTKEEQTLSDNSVDVDPCRAFFRALYAVPAATTTLGVGRVLLIGPLGERPLHICVFRADEWEEAGLTEGLGVKQGILEAVKAFIDHGGRHGELDVQYGKDYCAAVGSYLRRRGSAAHAVPWEERQPEKTSWWPASSTKVDLHSQRVLFSRRRPGSTGVGRFSAPAWSDLVEWSRGPAARDCCWRWMDPVLGPGRRDLDALVTCGLYEGESALLFMIASRNEDMVAWILHTGARCGTAARSTRPDAISDSCRRAVTPTAAGGGGGGGGGGVAERIRSCRGSSSGLAAGACARLVRRLGAAQAKCGAATLLSLAHTPGRHRPWIPRLSAAAA